MEKTKTNTYLQTNVIFIIDSTFQKDKILFIEKLREKNEGLLLNLPYLFFDWVRKNFEISLIVSSK